MLFQNPPSKHCELRVAVLNMGKKVGRVERVVAYVSPRNVPNIPVAAGVTVSRAETALRQPEPIMEIQPDGGKVYWELKLANWPKFDTHQKNGQDMGSGYVRLTSGEKLPFEFPMLFSDSQMILELANPDA